MEPRFKPGDLVRITSSGARSPLWRIIEEDTNRTPIHDPEPAYHLRNAANHERYAYESELRAA